jgi:iron complex outermembrane recepter protein
MKKLLSITQLLIMLGMVVSISLNAQSRSRVQGVVTDQNGDPMPGATVIIEGTYSGTATAADGSYSLQVNREGIYNIKVSFVGYHSQSREIDITGTVTANFRLEPAALPANEVVVQATRAGSRTPVTYSNIDSEELRKANYARDIPFLLSLTPSLVETSEAGTGIGYTAMRIRGSDASRINVTVDGIPVNDAESQQVFWVNMPDFASSVENIQVQRGVGTSGNGAAAFGASVNIQTMSPGSTPSLSTETLFGSFNTRKNSVKAETGLLNDRFAFMLRYSEVKSDGYIRHSGSDHRSMFLTGVYSANRSRLKTNIIIGEERTGISWWGVPAEMLDTDRRYNPAGIFTDSDGETQYYTDQTDNYWQNHYHLIYSRNMGSGWFLHTAAHLTTGNGYYEQYRSDNRLSAYGLEPVVIGGETIARTDLVRRRMMDNIFYGTTFSAKYIGGTTEAVIGGAVNRHDGDHFGRVIWMRHAVNTDKDYEYYNNKGVKDEFNIYGKLTIDLLPQLSLFGDLQYRRIEYAMTGLDDNLVAMNHNYKYNFVNPKAGLFYSPSVGNSFYASVAVAHREPTRANLKDAIGDDDATPQHERLTNFEAGYLLRKSNASLGVNLYYMTYNDQLVPTGELSNVGYPIMTNVKESYRRGIEITTSVKPAEIVELNGSVTLSNNRIANFTMYYTEYNTNDWSEEYKSKELGITDIAYSPSIVASGALTLFPVRGVTLRTTAKYVGSQYFDNTMSDERKLDPYLVTGATAAYSFSFRGVQEAVVSLDVKNLLNNLYVSNGYGGIWYEDGVENTWAYYFPQAGRHYMLRMAITF